MDDCKEEEKREKRRNVWERFRWQLLRPSLGSENLAFSPTLTILNTSIYACLYPLYYSLSTLVWLYQLAGNEVLCVSQNALWGKMKR